MLLHSGSFPEAKTAVPSNRQRLGHRHRFQARAAGRDQRTARACDAPARGLLPPPARAHLRRGPGSPRTAPIARPSRRLAGPGRTGRTVSRRRGQAVPSLRSRPARGGLRNPDEAHALLPAPALRAPAWQERQRRLWIASVCERNAYSDARACASRDAARAAAHVAARPHEAPPGVFTDQAQPRLSGPLANAVCGSA